MTVAEHDYVSSHNAWSDNYAFDLKNNLLDDVLWSIFDIPITEKMNIENIIISTIVDTKLNNYKTDIPTIISQDICCLKNDSFKLRFLLEANGMNEAMDGTHGYQDTEFARRIHRLYNGLFFAINNFPVSVVNTRYYLEPRKIINGYNNYKIIEDGDKDQRPILNNVITKWKEIAPINKEILTSIWCQ